MKPIFEYTGMEERPETKTVHIYVLLRFEPNIMTMPFATLEIVAKENQFMFGTDTYNVINSKTMHSLAANYGIQGIEVLKAAVEYLKNECHQTRLLFVTGAI
jgi:hypothetical protein